jgi:hypothetical protein
MMKGTEKKYRVLIDDNYDYMDESARYGGGSFDTFEEAVTRCKELVDDSLEECYEEGMSGGELDGRYKMFGDDPFIMSDDPVGKYSSWDYAKVRSEEICREKAGLVEETEADPPEDDDEVPAVDPPEPAKRHSTRQFKYYDAWKTEVLTCPKCKWKGTFEQGSTETFEALMDCHCPECVYPDAPMLAIVSYPTREEAEENWDKLSDREKETWRERDEFEKRLEEETLKSPDQLPDIEGGLIELVWDSVGELGEGETVIRHRDQEIWREPEVYEGHSRFREVLEILEAKYEGRLVDLEPTSAASMCLYGDRIASIGRVEEWRKQLRARTFELRKQKEELLPRGEGSLTVDDLIEALINREQWQRAAKELGGYWKQRCGLLIEEFGADEALHDFHASMIIDSTIRCAVKATNPFAGFMEVSGIIADYYQEWAPRYRSLDNEVGRLHRQMLRDLLIQLHPPLETARVHKETLVAKGLPMSQPDPIDFW